MLDKFFGVHPAVIRSGCWTKMKPGEKDLYIYLMAESERHCSRELKRTDGQIHAAVGTAPRTLCNARKRLAEYRLIQYRRTQGNKFMYVICDPVTGMPYPGDAQQPLTCRKRAAPPRATGNHQLKVRGATNEQPLESYGLPRVFQ